MQEYICTHGRPGWEGFFEARGTYKVYMCRCVLYTYTTTLRVIRRLGEGVCGSRGGLSWGLSWALVGSGRLSWWALVGALVGSHGRLSWALVLALMGSRDRLSWAVVGAPSGAPSGVEHPSGRYCECHSGRYSGRPFLHSGRDSGRAVDAHF